MQATESKTYKRDHDTIMVEIHDTTKAFAWRLVVNGKAGDWHRHYESFAQCDGWMVATPYWSSEEFQYWTPFKPQYATEV